MSEVVDHVEIDLDEVCPGCGKTIYDERTTGVHWEDLSDVERRYWVERNYTASYGTCPGGRWT